MVRAIFVASHAAFASVLVLGKLGHSARLDPTARLLAGLLLEKLLGAVGLAAVYFAVLHFVRFVGKQLGLERIEFELQDEFLRHD